MQQTNVVKEDYRLKLCSAYPVSTITVTSGEVASGCRRAASSKLFLDLINTFLESLLEVVSEKRVKNWV